MDVLWNLVIFTAGFVSGGLTVVVVLLAARMRAGARQAGDQLLDDLGPVGARRFFEATQE